MCLMLMLHAVHLLAGLESLFLSSFEGLGKNGGDSLEDLNVGSCESVEGEKMVTNINTTNI